eukprot:7542290-Alexandrium_andersonii.AAC.1
MHDGRGVHTSAPALTADSASYGSARTVMAPLRRCKNRYGSLWLLEVAKSGTEQSKSGMGPPTLSATLAQHWMHYTRAQL